MKKVIVSFVLLAVASLAVTSEEPARYQTVTLQQRLQQMEVQAAKMAASHETTMARMRAIQSQLDKLIEAIKAFRGKV